MHQTTGGLEYAVTRDGTVYARVFETEAMFVRTRPRA